MSATKNYYEQFFQEEHHDFVDESSYEDYLQMQREHQMQEELEREGLIGENKIPINWENQANDFLNKSESNNDLPF